MSDREDPRRLIAGIAIAHGQVALSSGRQTDRYFGLRRITRRHRAAHAGQAMRDLIRDWGFGAVGERTLGANPVPAPMLRAVAAKSPPVSVDAFVVDKQGNEHGPQQRVEEPEIAGRVLAVEVASTTGSSGLTAVKALVGVGADPIEVAVAGDRGAKEAARSAGLAYRTTYTLADVGLAA